MLLVDDEEAAIRSTERALKRHGICVRGITSASEALRPGAVDAYDAVLLDVVLGRDSGLDVCAELRSRGCKKPILMLSGQDDLELKLRALGPDVQADDYLPKPMEPAEIAAHVRAVIRRSSRPPAPPLTISKDGRSVRVNGAFVSLTQFERRVLLRLKKAHGQIVTFDELMALNGQTEKHACESLISRLRKKLGAVGRRIVTVNGTGCRLVL